MRERTGAWMVTVTHDQATAHNTRTNVVAATSVTLFPVGWRVGRMWSQPVPKSVMLTATRLAKRMTRNAHTAAAPGGVPAQPVSRKIVLR